MDDRKPLDLYVVESLHPTDGWEFVEWYRDRDRAEANMYRMIARYPERHRLVHYADGSAVLSPSPAKEESNG